MKFQYVAKTSVTFSECIQMVFIKCLTISESYSERYLTWFYDGLQMQITFIQFSYLLCKDEGLGGSEGSGEVEGLRKGEGLVNIW